MNNVYQKMVTARVFPPPEKITVAPGLCKLADGFRLTIESPDTVDAAEAQRLSQAYWNAACALTVRRGGAGIAPDGYALDVTTEGVSLCCSDRGGMLNGFKSLRQLAESERGVLKATSFNLPCASITDRPRFAFRGLHLCWFPSTEISEIERAIRIAAYYKFNYVVIESWGVFQYACHPEMVWSEYAVPATELRRLVAMSQELGVTLIPQVGIFGHATQARSCSGKHVLLDFHPEYSSLFEPDGWTWCISNPATRTFLSDIIQESLDIFDHPAYFHIGCDEAHNAGSCSLCAENYPTKLRDHILYFHDLLKKSGSQTIMWHDMLLEYGDPRWQGYRAYGSSTLRELYRELPRDIVIADWEYNGGDNRGDNGEPSWPTVQFFKAQGFRSILCPWSEVSFTAKLGQAAAANGLEGILATTWNHFQRLGMIDIILTGAVASWNPTCPHWDPEARSLAAGIVTNREYLCRNLREVNHDMKITTYTQTGNTRFQLP